jgi:hypothetical protein
MDLARSIQGDRGDHAAHRRGTRTRRPGKRTSASPAASRSTAWPTACSCARARSTISGSSPPPATPAARSARARRLSPRGPRRCSASRARSRARPGSTTACAAPARPAFYDADIALLPRARARSSTRVRSATTTLADRVAELIASENVIGWFQGRMEFGPRALGNRSIIGDARSPKMQSVMNLKIKFRESFRPFAPIVLRERASEYFDIDKPQHESPTCCSWRRCARRSASRSTATAQVRPRQAQAAALGRPGDHARRLLGARADGRRAERNPRSPACCAASSSAPAARC